MIWDDNDIITSYDTYTYKIALLLVSVVFVSRVGATQYKKALPHRLLSFKMAADQER